MHAPPQPKVVLGNLHVHHKMTELGSAKIYWHSENREFMVLLGPADELTALLWTLAGVYDKGKEGESGRWADG